MFVKMACSLIDICLTPVPYTRSIGNLACHPYIKKKCVKNKVGHTVGGKWKSWTVTNGVFQHPFLGCYIALTITHPSRVTDLLPVGFSNIIIMCKNGID